jgi:hypothetical protein
MRLSGTSSSDIIMNNPFWQGTSNNPFEKFALYGNSDFYPEDGWELIKSDFGYLSNGTTLRSTLPTLVYFCLYNRHTGTMRFFGALPEVTSAFKIINFTTKILTHKKNTSNPTPANRNLDATNLLSIQGSSIGALDSKTDEVSFNVLTEFPGADPGGYFFWFDLPVAYDPCLCYNNVAIEMNGILIQEATFNATGSLLGIVQEIVTPSASNYSELVSKKILGAGFALATALATNGSIVQVEKFIELIDIIVNKPGIPDDEKTKWVMFQKFLNASNNLTRENGKWVDYLTKQTLNDEDVVKMMGAINTYASSVMNIGEKGDGGSSLTTVNGKINLNGNVTNYTNISSTPYWAAPGSKLALDCQEEVTTESNISNLKNPEYPLYNEALGTFALLKTPKLKLNISRIWEFSENQYLWEPDPNIPSQQRKAYWSCDGFKIQGYLPEDLSFVFNPKMHLNMDKTKISAMISVEFGKSSENWNWELMDENKIPQQYKVSMNVPAIKDKNPINMEYLSISKTLTTFPVNINDFRELYFQANIITKDYNSFISPANPNTDLDIDNDYKPQVYLKLYFEYESNDIGKDGKPIKSTQLISLPYEIETFDGTFPLPKYNLITKDIVNLDQPNGQNFSNNEIIYAEIVNITTNVTASPGSIVRIRATKKINVATGVQIGPGVILEIVKNPFLSLYPQAPKNTTYVSNYCLGLTTDATYRANKWVGSLVIPSKESDTNPSISIPLKKSDTYILKIHPNPTEDLIKIDWFSINSEPLQIDFIDASGITIKSDLLKKETYDITSFASGIYFVRITCSDGIIRSGRFIKI